MPAPRAINIGALARPPCPVPLLLASRRYRRICPPSPSPATPPLLEHSPTAYEKQFYYNGITGGSDHLELIYRSDYHTTPFAKPTGKYGQVPVKSVHCVFDTPLNAVWGTVGPQIRNVVKAHGVKYSSIDTARFYTHGPPGEEEKGSLGPPVIWMGVWPGSTSAETAHDVSQAILTLLEKNEVTEVVVEWREAVVQRLAGDIPRQCRETL